MARILLADDDLDFQAMVRKVLQGVGQEVTTADTGAAAFEKSLARAFDLVITDISMPDGDGMEVIQAIRKRNPGAKFIAMSGGGLFPANQYLDAAKRLGASQTLTKPVSIGELLARVDSVLAEGCAVGAMAGE
jgi:CheY-like chemotaxis protein